MFKNSFAQVREMGYNLSFCLSYLLQSIIYTYNLSITSLKLFYFIFIFTFDMSLFQKTYRNRYAQRFLPVSKMN